MGLLVGAHFSCRKGKGRAGSSRDPPPFPAQRPKGYFLRFQASIQRIYACLRQRLVESRYAAGISRSRQRHWMRALQRQVAAYLGEGFRDRMLEGFSALLERGGVPVASNLAC